MDLRITKHPQTTFSAGTGPGIQAKDGSSVELYRLFRPRGEPEIIRDALEPGAKVLELGCGVGRITHPLSAMGFDVVAIDNCEEMLGFVTGVMKVSADIETLNLERTFDAVLLMSHLINTPDANTRQVYLSTCRRHLAPDGVAIIQRHDPKWLDNATKGFLGSAAEVDTFLERIVRRDLYVEMTIRYTSARNVWTHSFVSERLSEDAVQTSLQSGGLPFDGWLDDRKTWFLARASKL